MEQLHKIQAKLSNHLHQAQQTQKDYVDRHWLPSYLDIGDRLWILRQHIKTTRPCAKLDCQRLGPFRINEIINDVTFRLDLPSQLRTPLVFHSSLLEPCQEISIPNRTTPPPLPIELQDGHEYEVASILDSKIVRNKLSYLVDWLGI